MTTSTERAPNLEGARERPPTPDAPGFKPVAAIDTGRFFACGLLGDGSVTCWQTFYVTVPTPTDISGQPAPAGPFHELSVGEFHACALRDGGEVVCWGDNAHGQAAPPPGLLLAHVSAGSYHTCGLRFDGTVVCWGDGGAGCGP